MRKSYKRWFGMTLTICLLVTTLAGCKTDNKKPVDNGGKVDTSITDQKEDNKGKQEGPFAKYQPIEGKTYDISWTVGQLAPIDENAEMTQYWNEKWNVKLDIWNIDNAQWHEIINLRFATGEIPDKVRVLGFPTLKKYYDQDLLAEIPEDVLQHMAPTVYKYHTTDVPGALNYGKIDGKLYGIPHYSISANYRRPVVWRGDWLENVGITKTPETLDEFEEAMYKFTKEDPDKNGKNDTYGLSTTGLNAVYGAYGFLPANWAVRDGKLVYGAVQPEMKQALEKLSKWYKDGIIDPEFITGENKGGYSHISHSFVTGQVGYTSHGFYYHWRPQMGEDDKDVIGHNIQELLKTTPEVVDSLIFGLPPVGPEGKSGVPQETIVSGIFDGLGKHLEEEPDKIGKILLMFEDLVATFDNFLTARQGFEGKHWEWQNNMPVRLEPYTDGKELSKIGAMPVMTLISPYEYESKLLPLRIKFANDNKFDVGGIREELLSPLESQGKYQTELDKIREETYVSIIIGDKPIDYFDTFVDQWYKSGGEQLEKEANEWYQSLSK
ncbi:MAG: extracellular solute-binding protein [Epulopiscium sp.]|nr:extracellular solute-binding protein [Candidatus Epulonipiscium sp.]